MLAGGAGAIANDMGLGTVHADESKRVTSELATPNSEVKRLLETDKRYATGLSVSKSCQTQFRKGCALSNRSGRVVSQNDGLQHHTYDAGDSFGAPNVVGRTRNNIG